MKNADLEIRAVMFEKDGLTYVQCIDEDMLSYGKTEDAAIKSFEAMVSVYLHVRRESKKELFRGSSKVPAEFLRQFEDPSGEKREISLRMHPVIELDLSVKAEDDHIKAVLKKRAAA